MTLSLIFLTVPYDPRFHYRKLYHTCLTQFQSQDALLSWDGGLGEDLQAMAKLLNPFAVKAKHLPGNETLDIESISILEMIGLHERFQYNLEVAFRALCQLLKQGQQQEEAGDFRKDSRLEALKCYCLKHLLGLGYVDVPIKHRKTQTHYAIHILNLLVIKEEPNFIETVQKAAEKNLTDYLKVKSIFV